LQIVDSLKQLTIVNSWWINETLQSKRKVIKIDCYWKAQMLVEEYVLKNLHKNVLVLNQISACGKWPTEPKVSLSIIS